jgi:uncharacterized protein DUF6966
MDSRARLVAALSDTAELLRSHAVEYWPERLESYAEWVRLADMESVPSLAAEFGGMGSFNDVWIDPRNGHRITLEQVQTVNQRFSKLRAEIYELARSL